MVLHVKAGATAVNVTVASPTACSQGSTHNLVVNVAVNTERIIGPFPAQRFGQPVGGRVNVTYDQVAGITVAAIRI